MSIGFRAITKVLFQNHNIVDQFVLLHVFIQSNSLKSSIIKIIIKFIWRLKIEDLTLVLSKSFFIEIFILFL